MENLLKTGSSSIILGYEHYKGYFPYKNGKLLKVTKIANNHNEFKYLNIIKTIENYDNFYSIPENDITILLQDSKFYKKLINLTLKDEMSIFNSNLCCMYIDYAGTLDVLDTLNLFVHDNDRSIWDGLDAILKFTKQISLGLYFIHKKKICHNDIKCENIMVQKKNDNIIFKIIDFGFSSIEPFDDYIIYFKGTPGYFPCHFPKINYVQDGLPKIYANDFYLVNNNIPMTINRKLVYKIDSYCLGRVLNMIYYYYLESDLNFGFCCFNYNCSKKKLIKKIINLLLDSDCNSRITITELIDRNIIK